LIQDTLMKIIESPVDLIFVVKAPSQTQNTNSTMAPLFAQVEPESEQVMHQITKAKLRPGFVFENFAVSGSNQMAYAAAETVAKNRGNAYNPLFIWGGVGVGKTHLMHAVGHYLIKQDINTKILACTAEEFTNDIVAGIMNKSTQAVREKYRKLDALFVDDIQFIGGKDTAQEEFFHTFNAVTGAGGQVILTADQPPHEIKGIEDRLRSRFEAGFVADIAGPDFELRAAIIQIKTIERGIEIPLDLVHLIAGNITTARQIEGFLIRLSSEIKLQKMPVNEMMIKQMLNRGSHQMEEKKLNNISPDKMFETVCKHYNVSKKAILGRARSQIIAKPRQILMYLLRTELNMPLEEVGRFLDRDHTTIMHGVDKITNLNSTNGDIREDIMRIKQLL